jgi:hypothetical protein
LLEVAAFVGRAPLAWLLFVRLPGFSLVLKAFDLSGE